MSAIGLPMEDHVTPHFCEHGLCQCPCGECTTRGFQLCVCLDCPCDGPADHSQVSR